MERKMKTLYLDCGMGAAGDMLTAALFELLDEKGKTAFLEKMNGMGIPNVNVVTESMTKCGIVGTHMKVTVGGVEEDACAHGHEGEHEHNYEKEHSQEEEHEHHHEQSDDHEHNHDEHNHEKEHDHSRTHQHRGMDEIEHIINSLSVIDIVKKNAIEVYKLIAEAESHAHGVAVTEIHFHEVGTMDAIADVTAVCLLMEMLGIEKVFASAVHVGSGHVHCMHGILPVPAPATAYILKDVPIYGGGIKGELCTPTGAALLKHFVTGFGDMPVMKAEKIGYGMGKKDFTAVNCVRAILGEVNDGGDQVVELTCNVDDMTPEKIGFAMEYMLENGALEAYTVPVGMKKSRPGVMLCVMCKEEKRDEMIHLLFKHTTTLGIRQNVSNRFVLKRRVESVKTVFGDVRVKYSEGYGVTRVKYEYDDLARIAKEQGLSIDEVVRIIDDGQE